MKLKGQVKFVNPNKNLFFNTLKKRVDQYFLEKNLSKHANVHMVIKSAILLLGYILPFVFILLTPLSFPGSLFLWLIMGICLAGIGMSVMHDANHGSYSENKAVNYIMGHMLNLLGGSVFNWKLQHNILHHTYTNIDQMDEDIEDRIILKFSPHSRHKKVHKFQWLYAFMFYGLITIYWVLAKDFIQFFKYTRNGVNTHTKSENVFILAKIALLKLVYLTVLFVVPTVIFNIPFAHILSGFLLMHFVGGIILTTVFQLAHTVEGTSHPLPDNNGNIQNDWAIHQLNTTVNFSKNNKLICWYVGGLNFQIEHHLFPRISHIHYPAIAEIVKKTAEEFDLPYMENRTFLDALRSHIATLQNLGRLPDLNEAIA